jgi:glycine/D-amino acid oxidase-like deaminating enzyme
MQKAISRIVIVGGGTAGWITASLIAARHHLDAERKLTIVLIESPDIPTIGVGEGTWPSMRQTLQKIGIREADLVRDCDASFKQGTQFLDWSAVGDEHHYIHPFSFPAEYSNLNLAGHWLGHASNTSFAEFVTPQAAVIAAGLAPKQASTPEYAFNVNYGYHFDAGKFAQLLHRHATKNLGVEYLQANVTDVESSADGDIAALTLDTGKRVDGDLFVDCTGQRGLLIHEHFGIDFVSVKDVLFNDAAIAVQVPYASPDDPIASVTRATAVANGWIWDIGLQSRRGLGHVYSTAHSDEATAMAAIRDYVRRTAPGCDMDKLNFRSIPFAPGYRRRFWVQNCVAVGLSGGFIEPLEASALALIEHSAAIISQQLPFNREIMDVVASRFNSRMLYNWQRVIEFLKLHYIISARDDSDYWRDCRVAESCSQELRDKLTLWQQLPPWHDDAPRVDELFPSASYQYVLFGMGFRPEHKYVSATELERDRSRVESLLHENQEKARQMSRLLPTNRELINSMTSLRGVA